MTADLRMLTRSGFGAPRDALLNRELMRALQASMPGCETCRDIAKDVETTAEGGEYRELAGFPGMSVMKLDAHFKAHWGAGYELVLLPGRGAFRKGPG